MKVLVTGGAGFIGSNLCSRLLLDGHYVICIDNFITGSRKNVDQFLNYKNFKFIYDDARDVANEKVDWIFHLASPTEPDKTIKYEDMTYEINSNATKRWLDFSNKINAKFLFVSSVKVDSNCHRTQTYIIGKKKGEKFCLESNAKIARLGSTFGPGMKKDDSRVIPVFIKKAFLNEPISVWNGGLQVDSFCYVDDIIDGLILFMKFEETGIIEFGSPDKVSIISLANLIINIIGSSSKIINNENILSEDEFKKTPDISKAIDLFDWFPKVDLKTGLFRTILYNNIL